MKRILHLILLQVLFIFLSVTSYSQAGTLDPTFGTNGIVSYDWGGGHDNANDIHVFEDTSMIICGTKMASGFVASGILQKFLPNGDVDISWATNGIVEFQYGVDTYPYTMIVQADGKILISGVIYTTVSDAEFYVSRFNPDGSPDNTFNGDGKWIGSYSSSEEVAETMIVQPDGKIVLAGRTYAGAFSQLLFARVNSDGSLDTGFGTNGYTEIDASPQDERINGLGILSNGYIIGVGYGYVSNPWFGEFAKVVKLDASGNPDNSFGTNGVMIPTVFTDISLAWDCIIINDTLIISAKHYDASNNQNLAVAKLDQNGNPDPNFGTGGISKLNVDPLTIGYQIHRYSDGNLYICGTAGLGGMNNRDFLLVRYNYDGSLDMTFNGTGYVKTNIRPDWDEANAMDFQPDGKIVLAGFSSGLSTGTDNDRNLVRYLNDYAPPVFSADFTADQTIVCEGEFVNFSDLSIGNIISWEWNFEGGTPATSTLQNPVIAYNTVGLYDVQLIVFDGTDYDTTLKTDYIQVEILPAAPMQPTGEIELCGGYDTEYTTESVTYTTEYDWEVSPADAGTITGNDTIGYFESSDSWTGSYAIKVRAVSLCGDGPWSPDHSCDLYLSPAMFSLLGDGGYCSGDPGFELKLNGSETGVDYELYKDGAATGTILAGTGDTLNFGYIADEGLYSTFGYTDYCSEERVGQIWIHEVFPPAQPGTPAGAEQVCNNDSSYYSTVLDPDVSAYVWGLNPEEAGSLYSLHDSVLVYWNPSFSGMITLSVIAINACGDSPESEALSIDVFESPSPEITGLQTVCSGFEESYQTGNNSGSTYTWIVEGGVINSGTGTSAITVLWGDPGMGSIIVTEVTADACSVTTEEYEVTIDDCTGISENSLEYLVIYPNPANTSINVKISLSNTANKCEIKLVNTLGEMIEQISWSHNNDTYHINTSNYEPGIYFLQIYEKDKLIASEKFIISH